MHLAAHGTIDWRSMLTHFYFCALNSSFLVRIILNVIVIFMVILKFNKLLSRISYVVQRRKINFQFYFDCSQTYLDTGDAGSQAAYKLLTYELDF